MANEHRYPTRILWKSRLTIWTLGIKVLEYRRWQIYLPSNADRRRLPFEEVSAGFWKSASSLASRTDPDLRYLTDLLARGQTLLKPFDALRPEENRPLSGFN